MRFGSRLQGGLEDCGLMILRVSGNGLGGKHTAAVAAALRAMAGLRELDLSGTLLHDWLL